MSSQNKFYLVFICILLPLLLHLLFNISFEYFYSGAKDIEYLKKMVTVINMATLLISIITIICLIISLRLFTHIFETEIKEKHLQQSVTHFKEMMSKISKQRHDFNNHLQMIYGLMELAQYDKAKEYLNTLFSDISVYNEALKSNNIELAALLHSKIEQAEAKNIKFDLYLSGSITHLPLSLMELSSIIGNLADNAIAAAEDSPADKRNIALHIEQSGPYLLMSISNHTDRVKPEMTEFLFKKGFSTKKSTGLGLGIVKEITERHNGRLEVNLHSGMITFTVIIPFSESEFKSVASSGS